MVSKRSSFYMDFYKKTQSNQIFSNNFVCINYQICKIPTKINDYN